MNSNSFAIVSRATAMLKMKTLSTVFFFRLRIFALYVDEFVDLDVSACKTAAFPPSARVVVAGILLLLRRILVAVAEAFEAHPHSNKEPSVSCSVFVQLSWLCGRAFPERYGRKA